MRDTPEIGLDSIFHIIQNLSPAQRSEVAKVVSRLDGGQAATGGASGSASSSGGNMAPTSDISYETSPSVTPE